MKNVSITIPIGINVGPTGFIGTKQLTFNVQVPDRFTADDVSRTISGKLEDVLEKYVKFGKD